MFTVYGFILQSSFRSGQESGHFSGLDCPVFIMLHHSDKIYGKNGAV